MTEPNSSCDESDRRFMKLLLEKYPDTFTDEPEKEKKLSKTRNRKGEKEKVKSPIFKRLNERIAERKLAQELKRHVHMAFGKTSIPKTAWSPNHLKRKKEKHQTPDVWTYKSESKGNCEFADYLRNKSYQGHRKQVLHENDQPNSSRSHSSTCVPNPDELYSFVNTRKRKAPRSEVDNRRFKKRFLDERIPNPDSEKAFPLIDLTSPVRSSISSQEIYHQCQETTNRELNPSEVSSKQEKIRPKVVSNVSVRASLTRQILEIFRNQRAQKLAESFKSQESRYSKSNSGDKNQNLLNGTNYEARQFTPLKSSSPILSKEEPGNSVSRRKASIGELKRIKKERSLLDLKNKNLEIQGGNQNWEKVNPLKADSPILSKGEKFRKRKIRVESRSVS